MATNIPNYMKTDNVDPEFKNGVNKLCETIDIPADPFKRSDGDNWMLLLALLLLISGGNLNEITMALKEKENDPSKLPQLRSSD